MSETRSVEETGLSRRGRRLAGRWNDVHHRRGFAAANAQFFVGNGSTADHESGDTRADDERKTRRGGTRQGWNAAAESAGSKRRESEQTEERTGRGEQPESEPSMTLPVAVYVTLTVTVILVYTTRTRPSRGAERSKWRVV